ncbi:MAG TPA: GAF domain-containing protein [Anaerolineae bacterium]|nr:GAF domain-containing protein [Anaerolineae bacterium]
MAKKAEAEDLHIGLMRDRLSTGQDLQGWREELITRVLRVMCSIGGLLLLAGAIYRLTQQRFLDIVLFLSIYGILLFITLRRRLGYVTRVRVMMALAYGLALTDFLSDGRTGGARIFLLIFVFTAAVFLGERSAINALIVAAGTNVVFAIAFSSGFLTVSEVATSTNLAAWGSGVLVMLGMGIFIVASINYLIPRLIAAMTESGHLARELTDYQDRLEDLVAQQEIDLSRRGARLQTAAQVAREVAGLGDLAQALARTVQLISEQFDFYHAAIYLLEVGEARLALRAASSRGGQLLLAEGYTLRLEEGGLVVHAAVHGEPRIAADVTEDAVFVYNPLLPNTRAEIALPLQGREGIIGVLDVQSDQPRAFTEDDVVVLRTLADHISLVISNAELLRRLEARLESERQIYQQMERRDWVALAAAMKAPGHVRNQQGIMPSAAELRPHMQQALQQVAPVADESSQAVALPIKVRGQIVGVIDARKRPGAGGWTQDELLLLETLGEQLDPALDSARLYQSSQLLANRERFTREIADKMRRAVDMDDLIRTTVEEMAAVLDAPLTFVQLAQPAADEAAKQPAEG